MKGARLLLVNSQLIKKMEAAESYTLQQRLQSYMEQPGNPMGVEIGAFEGAKAFVVKKIPGPSLNTVRLLTPSHLPLLPDIIDFYKQHKSTPTFDISPTTNIEPLLRGLSEYGFYQAGFHVCLFKPINPDTSISHNELSTQLNGNDSSYFGELYAGAFAMPSSFSETIGLNNEQLMDDPNWFYYHRDDSFGVLHIDGDVANLTGAGTLPKKRGKGHHQNLIHTRILKSAQASCSLAIAQASFQSQSMSNLMKSGFLIGYMRAIWRKR
ncbi:acetyltransferase [Geomicrobium sp. JCM 19039]|nr:acetyltransferase [Geomicrobium sp. JCM 19039]